MQFKFEHIRVINLYRMEMYEFIDERGEEEERVTDCYMDNR